MRDRRSRRKRVGRCVRATHRSGGWAMRRVSAKFAVCLVVAASLSSCGGGHVVEGSDIAFAFEGMTQCDPATGNTSNVTVGTIAFTNTSEAPLELVSAELISAEAMVLDRSYVVPVVADSESNATSIAMGNFGSWPPDGYAAAQDRQGSSTRTAMRPLEGFKVPGKQAEKQASIVAYNVVLHIVTKAADSAMGGLRVTYSDSSGRIREQVAHISNAFTTRRDSGGNAVCTFAD